MADLTPGSPEWRRWLYKSRFWKRKRRDTLKRDNYECQRCKREGRYSRATDVHHIEHLDKRPDLALVDSNLESLCVRCHNQVHPEKFARIEARKRQAIAPERW